MILSWGEMYFTEINNIGGNLNSYLIAERVIRWPRLLYFLVGTISEVGCTVNWKNKTKSPMLSDDHALRRDTSKPFWLPNTRFSERGSRCFILQLSCSPVTVCNSTGHIPSTYFLYEVHFVCNDTRQCHGNNNFSQQQGLFVIFSLKQKGLCSNK